MRHLLIYPLLLLAGLLWTHSSARALDPCEGVGPAERIFGWYGAGEDAIWLYPAAKNALGLFHAAKQRRYLLETPPEADAEAFVFGEAWRLAVRSEDCSRPGTVTLTDMAVGTSESLSAAQPPYAVRDVRFASAGTALGGLTLVPASPRAAIAIIHGHGSSDRDSGAYLAIADALARRGYAVLLPDKRGSGLSQGDWREVGFEALAQDALAGLDLLSEQAGEVPGGLLTVSQGGWIGPIAAAVAPERVDFVINLVGPAVTLAEQQKNLIETLIVQHDFNEDVAQRIRTARFAAEAFGADDSDDNWSRYVAARGALLDTPAAALAESFPDSRDDWDWDWGRRVTYVDPIPIMERSGKPYLAIYGRDDSNIAVAPNTNRIVRSEADITLLVLPGRGHNLASPSEGVIDALVFDTIETWISAQLGS